MPRSLPARVSPKRTHGFPIRNDAPPTGIRHRRPKRHAERDRSAWRCTKGRSEEHTSELQSLMRISYAVFCLKKKTKTIHNTRQLEYKLTMTRLHITDKYEHNIDAS